MLTGTMSSAVAANDAELVKASLSGEREAFGHIVARYQTLICSLAYSATGNLGQSEDLAQETFVTAWKQLAHLREPEKLRPWLCGIARNLVNNSLRKQKREPSHAAEPIETASHSHSPEPLPVERTISNEEQAILWRSLEKIPETYREPLVLFYREHKSVEAVAEKLELNADAVHQRLSRGRKLLAEEVTAFVEGALARTNPGQTFTLGVMAALPAVTFSIKAAALGAATKSGAAVKGSVLGLWFGPALGLVCGYLGWREGLKNTRTPRERAYVIRYTIILLAGGILFFVCCSLFASFVPPRLWPRHPVLTITFGIATTLTWAVFVFTMTWRHRRAMARMREEEQQIHPELSATESSEIWEYRSRATLLGLPLVHWRASWSQRPGQKIKPAVGWIAGGEIAFGVLYATGAVAVGGISSGAVSIGILSFGGFGLGLLAFGGIAFGAVAIGGLAIGLIASGGIALGWHAALGGIVAARELASGGSALAPHANDELARDFFLRYRWLDFTQPGSRNLFWGLCFGPLLLQMLLWTWWRKKTQKRTLQKLMHPL